MTDPFTFAAFLNMHSDGLILAVVIATVAAAAWLIAEH